MLGHLDSILVVVSVLVPTFSVLSALQVYIGIGLSKDLAELPEQMSNFKLKDAQCFCCSVDHVHPETGEELPCDRKLVFQTIKTWYGTAAGGDNHLDAFDDIVRNRLKTLVMARLGKSVVPVRYILPIVLSATVPFLPFYLPEWVEGEPGYSTQDAVTFQIRELVDFFKITATGCFKPWVGWVG